MRLIYHDFSFFEYEVAGYQEPKLYTVGYVVKQKFYKKM